MLRSNPAVSLVTPNARPRRRPSAVSQALSALTEGPASEGFAGNEAGHLHMRVANNLCAREKAYRLAYEIYRKKGYIAKDGTCKMATIHDAQPNTVTLVAEDTKGHAAATLTLVYDGDDGLPCDEIFERDLVPLRRQGRRIAEVTRLAIADGHARSRILLVRLFNWAYIHARRIMRSDDFVIEVNPRHVKYYCRLLGFRVLCAPRPCPRVQGAPAVLLRVDFEYGDREVARWAGQDGEANERSLYPHFLSPEEEFPVIQYLRRRHHPMTEAEALHFGIGRPTSV